MIAIGTADGRRDRVGDAGRGQAGQHEPAAQPDHPSGVDAERGREDPHHDRAEHPERTGDDGQFERVPQRAPRLLARRRAAARQPPQRAPLEDEREHRAGRDRGDPVAGADDSDHNPLVMGGAGVQRDQAAARRRRHRRGWPARRGRRCRRRCARPEAVRGVARRPPPGARGGRGSTSSCRNCGAVSLPMQADARHCVQDRPHSPIDTGCSGFYSRAGVTRATLRPARFASARRESRAAGRARSPRRAPRRCRPGRWCPTHEPRRAPSR